MRHEGGSPGRSGSLAGLSAVEGVRIKRLSEVGGTEIEESRESQES